VLELHTRSLLCVFPIEAHLERLAGRFAAREAQRVVVEVQCLPAAIELDQLGKDWTGVARQRLQLRHNGIGFDTVVFAIRHRIELFPRQPGHATILVPGASASFAAPPAS
jgi:hypothetical protein